MKNKKDDTTQLELFTKPFSKLTCNSCERRQRWECNNKVFQYCGIRKSNLTNNGLLKIKCKTAACALYKPSMYD